MIMQGPNQAMEPRWQGTTQLRVERDGVESSKAQSSLLTANRSRRIVFDALILFSLGRSVLVMRKHVLILLLLLVIPLFCAASFVREWILVDSALDNGASFDYSRGGADYSANHPFVPYLDRHSTLIKMSTLSLVSAVAYGGYIASARLRSQAIHPAGATNSRKLLK